jgi:hypothetical protein
MFLGESESPSQIHLEMSQIWNQKIQRNQNWLRSPSIKQFSIRNQKNPKQIFSYFIILEVRLLSSSSVTFMRRKFSDHQNSIGILD